MHAHTNVLAKPEPLLPCAADKKKRTKVQSVCTKERCASYRLNVYIHYLMYESKYGNLIDLDQLRNVNRHNHLKVIV